MKNQTKKTLVAILFTGFLLGLVTSAQAMEILLGRAYTECRLTEPQRLSIELRFESSGDIFPEKKEIWNEVYSCAVGDAAAITLEIKKLVDNLFCVAGSIRDYTPSYPDEPESSSFSFSCGGHRKRIISVLWQLIYHVFTIQPITAP